MSKDFKIGFVPNEIYQLRKVGKSLRCFDQSGKNVGTLGTGTIVRGKAFNDGQALHAFVTKSGKKTYRRVSMELYNSKVATPLKTEAAVTVSEIPSEHMEIKNFIHNDSVQLRPDGLKMNDLKWKHLIRSAVRGKNIMMTGPTGCGKTMASKALVNALKRPDFYFNLGATQDPRSTLIGNTHFSGEAGKGTFFSESTFVKAIQTKDAIILLDELTRAHPDAHNILMTVLDQGQRYLRLDEADGSPTIKVAEGVTFIATANMGSEYTATRVLDRAMQDRFVIIEMELLNTAEEIDLLTMLYPDVHTKVLTAIAETANYTRVASRDDNSIISEMISTRATVEWASLVYDGFTFMDAASISVLPFFSNDGAPDSERTMVLQFLQKFNLDNLDEVETVASEPESVEFEVADDDELIF